MTLVELYQALKSTGLPVAYSHFSEPVEPPYITYLFAYSSNFSADNKVYTEQSNYQIELYTEKKEPNTEKLLENVLDSKNLFWDKTETFIDSENLYQIMYEISI